MLNSISDPSSPQTLDTHQKALAVNLDPRCYGTFAEIGAGQEVVRWFFRVGGAAGTIAKSISAYDMKVSDAIYGNASRYVCRERMQAMLNYEHDLNLEPFVRRAWRYHRFLCICRHRFRTQLPRHQRMSWLDGD